MTLLLLAMLSPSVQAADCATLSTAAELRASTQAATAAFEAMNLPAFTSAKEEAARFLECLGELISPADAAATHQLHALAAFLGKDDAGATASFVAVRSLTPHATLSEELAPLGHPLRAAWDAAGLIPPAAGIPLSPSPGEILYVDGLRGAQRPGSRPAIMQLTNVSGTVEHSTWLGAADPLPAWLLAPAPDPLADARTRAPKAARERRPAVLPLAITAGASALVAGGLYGYAWAPRGRFLDAATPYEDLDGYRSATNTATIGAAVAGGIAVGAGAGALISLSW